MWTVIFFPISCLLGSVYNYSFRVYDTEYVILHYVLIPVDLIALKKTDFKILRFYIFWQNYLTHDIECTYCRGRLPWGNGI